MIAAAAWRRGAALLSYDADLDRVSQVIGLTLDPASRCCRNPKRQTSANNYLFHRAAYANSMEKCFPTDGVVARLSVRITGAVSTWSMASIFPILSVR